MRVLLGLQARRAAGLRPQVLPLLFVEGVRGQLVLLGISLLCPAGTQDVQQVEERVGDGQHDRDHHYLQMRRTRVLPSVIYVHDCSGSRIRMWEYSYGKIRSMYNK